MISSTWMSNSDLGLETLDLALPELGAESDEGEGIEEGAGDDLLLTEVGGDPFDDRPLDDLPLDVQLDVAHDEPSALGDEDLGVGSDGDEGLAVDEREGSLLDDRGHAEEGLEFIGDDELGIDPIPREADDGGVEGLDDPSADSVDEFPPLDGAADDEEEIDLGIHLPE